MGRPKSIFIDPEKLLRGIAAAEREESERIQAVINAGYGDAGAMRNWQEANRAKSLLKGFGIKCRVADFFDEPLTASETLRAQKAVRELEAAGLVAIDGQRAAWVKVTDAGRAKLGVRPSDEVTYFHK